jgi:diguanylate cyclase (GGDEF)-like protein
MRYSIKKKFALLIFLTTALISVLLIAASTIVVRRLVDTMYKQTADNASYVAASIVNPEEVRVIKDKVLEIYKDSDKITSTDWGSEAFDNYQALYESIYDIPEYKSVLNDLKVVQDGSSVSCIYIYLPQYSDGRYDYIYLADADNAEPCPIGCIDSYDWADDQAEELTNNPDNGLDPYITNTEEYGWLVSNMRPIFAADRELIAYACTDVSMNDIRRTQNKFTIALVLAAIGIIGIIYLISTKILYQTMVKPLTKLSETAENYWANGKSGVRTDFAELNINSNDEIGVLSESMKKMENDINDYFIGLEATKQELGAAREESEVMRELAHRDGLTGIRNKTAYGIDIQEIEIVYSKGELDSYGIAMVDLNYLKVINDTYGHDKGDVAIKKICSVVCDVFEHSPVYRMGGDEFAIILTGRDLYYAKDLVVRFKKIVGHYASNESLEPWERVSAAIGYAVFDKDTDSFASDVFKRADAKMYEDKAAQKAQRVN